MSTTKSIPLTFQNILMAAMAAVIIWLLVRDLSGAKDVAVKETTKTEQKIDVREIVDSAINMALQNQKPKRVPYLVYQDRLVPVQNVNDLNKDDLSHLKEVNVYKDTTKLENAEIYSEIYAEGKVFGKKLTAKTFEKTITNTITHEKETIVNGSGFFLSGGGGTDGTQFNNVNVGLDYIRKNDVGVGYSFQYDLVTGQRIHNIRVLKKIF